VLRVVRNCSAGNYRQLRRREQLSQRLIENVLDQRAHRADGATAV